MVFYLRTFNSRCQGLHWAKALIIGSGTIGAPWPVLRETFVPSWLSKILLSLRLFTLLSILDRGRSAKDAGDWTWDYLQAKEMELYKAALH